MLRTIKPRNARSKRALEKREPQAIENQKRTLFLQGTSASEIVKIALNDIHSLKKPHTLKFTKKNPIHPFEDSTAFEFFSTKNDISLLLFASTSKKRPHNLTFIRTFDHRILDMIELGLDSDTFKPLSAFKNAKPAYGMKPMLLFAGGAWDSAPRYQHLKSMFMDFFRGPTVPQIDVEGLQYIVVFSAQEVTDENPTPKVHFRTYLIQTKRSGQKLPRIEVEEMGPRMDFSLRRVKEPEDEMMKEALKQAKKLEPKTRKNISMDIMGDKIGRIHTGKQDLSKLQSRKMKGLKRSKGGDDEDEEEGGNVDVDDDVTMVGQEEESTPKKAAKAKRARTK
ncbi:Brix domain-containing protein [Kalaharituber pfeilii]|nr:Brix domain-containing protein [Kalaharituber pfeilii]